jgi:hypothetical protein
MKSPQQPGNPSNIDKEPMSRSERFLKRGLPVLVGGVALAVVGVSIGQLIHNENTMVQHAQEQNDAQKKSDDFESELKAAAIRVADPHKVIPYTTLTKPGNHLYSEALSLAKSDGLLDGKNAAALVHEIHTSSVAIDAKGLIQPNSERKFILASVDVNKDGTDELIVQIAPPDLSNQ